ncbi:restriction endonuclease subunit S [Chromobacterium haemolyticum]|uniref:Restriction endonuclease subunit S n=1 Tax=Chromobacterium fluminis TaxID=3044269 RepID=A0ABX0L1Q9_9NEIS|nr:restriction endonuclease subunit S [Chromobacterium haemolyticum]NHR03597.1 restriction endonuclease subunit S [Chromobacterium haemolyticum]
MTLPAYSEYKDSGVKWLDTVPAHWKFTKTKHICSFSTGWTPPTGDSSAYEGDNLWANISDLGERFLVDTAKRISDEAVKKAGIPLSPKGSLLFSFKLSIGQVSFAGSDMYTNEAIATFRNSKELSVSYAYYAFPLFLVKNATDNIYGAKLLNQELIGSAILVLPPREEQNAITSFLDHETGKIDTLIAEQEKLLALLTEKRQATISHAVTKGLNPDVPMKDSGVEWLGKVPAHWKTTRLKYATSLIVDCPHETPAYSDDGAYKVIRTADISLGLLDSSKTYHVDEVEYINRIRRQALCKNDIIYGREGERWGFAALVPDDNIFCLGQRMMQFRAASTTCSSYLMWQLNSVSTYRQGQIDTVGATSPHVNVGTIRNYLLAEPPFKEQLSISNFLDRETAKLDALTAEANRTIELLKERRSALISAAVTGQIDVRQA